MVAILSVLRGTADTVDIIEGVLVCASMQFKSKANEKVKEINNPADLINLFFLQN